MNGYTDKTCDCCGEKFTEDDDIVVCPDCGTPIHRKCWNGHCPNELKHAEGFDWDKDQEKIREFEKLVLGRKTCIVCRKELNEGDDVVTCNSCGSLMHRHCREAIGSCPLEPYENPGYRPFLFLNRPDMQNDAADNTDGVDITRISTTEDPSFEDFVRQLRQIDEQSGMEHTCFGVKHIELLHFLGTHNFSTPRFFSLFFNMAETGRKVSFNFMAGLLMPFYQFYRKMIGPSVVLALAYMILEIPQMVITLMIGLRGSDALISAELYNILDVFFYILLVLRIIMILFNDYIYMRWSVGKILSLREQYRDKPEAEYMEALERAGRPKFVFVLIGVTGVYVLAYILLGILSTMGYFA